MPPDYDSTNIGYKIFLRAKDLSNAMARWQFLLNHNCCVSADPYASMFIIYFNHGYIFNVELSFFPDKFLV